MYICVLADAAYNPLILLPCPPPPHALTKEAFSVILKNQCYSKLIIVCCSDWINGKILLGLTSKPKVISHPIHRLY